MRAARALLPLSLLTLLAQVLHPIATPAAAQVIATIAPETRLSANDAAAFDWFGSAVALSDDMLAVGAPFDDDPIVGLATGSVYIYSRAGAVWSLELKLTAGDARAGDQFGASVALISDTLVVGAPYVDTRAAIDAGAAYVFERSGGIWSQLPRLAAADGQNNDRFGSAVALAPGTIAVGARQADAGPIADAGAVYVFERDARGWSQHTRLVAASPTANAGFGVAVALSGDTLAVGAPYTDDPVAGADAGAATLFTRAAGGWGQPVAIVPGEAGAGDQFGAAVALSGDTLAAGAPLRDTATGGSNAGAVYVFAHGADGWQQQTRLGAGDGAKGDQFGAALGLSGDALAVGAPLHNGAAGVAAGAAYLFGRSGSTWQPFDALAAGDAGAGDQFGAAVALSGDTLALGAPYANDVAVGNDTGAAYLARLSLSTIALVSSQNPSIEAERITFTATVAPAPPASSRPTGTVTFYSGPLPIGLATLDTRGQATLTLDSLAAGSNAIRASYGGDASLLPSNSAVLTQVVNPVVQFAAPAYSTAELSGTATISVTIGAPVPFPVSVDYATADDSALAGRDYAEAHGTLIFAPGQTVVSFTVAIRDDLYWEQDEALRLTLSNISGVPLGPRSSVLLTIDDDERGKPVLTYLPRTHTPLLADLAITAVRLSPARTSFSAGEPVTITVELENRGIGYAPPFWVDLYLNPKTAPTRANQPWYGQCTLYPCYGIAWGVAPGLYPGQRLTLSSSLGSYAAAYTRWPGFFTAGTTDLYVYADSWNPTGASGAVEESDEANNRAELHGLSVGQPAGAPDPAAPAPATPAPAAQYTLPTREMR